MEIDPINVEKSEQVRWSGSGEQSLGHVRLYRCTFCKRGFSNAQALGGHMNIHRKDRAKLREFSSDNNLLSLSISDHPCLDNDDESVLLPINSCDELAGNLSERPCIVPEEGDDHIPKGKNNDREDPLLLPLFVETPLPTSKGKETGSVVRDSSKGVQLSYGAPSPSPALDLELRLGVEPQQHDS